MPWSYSPFRLGRVFPVEGQVSVTTLPRQSEASPEESSEWSRNSNCVSPRATDATMLDRVSLCYGQAPKKSAPMDGTSAQNVLPLSQYQVEAQNEWELFSPSLKMTSEPKPRQDSHAMPGPAGGPSLRVEAGTARAVASSAASLREVPGFLSCQE